jgi:hypothetical protein
MGSLRQAPLSRLTMAIAAATLDWGYRKTKDCGLQNTTPFHAAADIDYAATQRDYRLAPGSAAVPVRGLGWMRPLLRPWLA